MDEETKKPAQDAYSNDDSDLNFDIDDSLLDDLDLGDDEAVEE